VSRTRPVSDASWTRRPLSTCLPVLGALPVHRARACNDAADDATTAGLGPSSRAWAVRQAGAAVAACEEGLRLRADVSVLQELRSALRSPGAGVVAAEASLGGSLLKAVSRRVSTGTPMAVPTMPPPMDTTVFERDTFSRLLCRIYLRYACRLHGPACSEPVPTTPGVVPVHLPPDPNVLASLEAHQRRSGVDHLFAGHEGNRPAAGHGAVVSAQVCGAVSLPAQSSVRLARLAAATHGEIGLAANACPDCRFDPRRHLRATEEGDDGWTADQVALLRANSGIVGQHDSCRLAAFVPGQTCRTVTAYIAAVGLPEERRRYLTPPLEDAPENDSPRRATGSPRFLSQAVSSQRPRQQGTTLSLSPSGMNDEDGRAADYRPCFHVGRCSPEVCRCARVNIPCEKYYGCARVRWVGTAAPDAATASSPSSGALVSTVGGRHAVDDEGWTTAGGSWAGPLSAFSASQSGPAAARGSRLCSRRVWCSCVAPSRCATDDCPCFAVDDATPT